MKRKSNKKARAEALQEAENLAKACATRKKDREELARRALQRQQDKDAELLRRHLPHKEHMAVEYYMRGMSQRDALIKAGYAETTAFDQQQRVFSRPRVVREIERRRAAMRQRSNNVVDRILEEYHRIAFFNIGELIRITGEGELIYDFTEAGVEEFAALGEVTVETYTEGKGPAAEKVKRIKVKPYDKKSALDSLAKIHGILQDGLMVTTEGGSLEERLARGRARIAGGGGPATIEGEVVSRDTSAGDEA